MTIADIVLGLKESQELAAVIAAKGLKMETAFCWHHIKTMHEDRWIVSSHKSDIPAPALEELLAYVKTMMYENELLIVGISGDKELVVCELQGFKKAISGYGETVLLAAKELIMRMVGK